MLNLNLPAGDADHLPITEQQLARWLATALPGDRIAYHRGHLARDRCDAFSTLPLQRRQELQRVAGRAFVAIAQGFVHALQRRNGPFDFTYLLIVRPGRLSTRRRLHAALPSATREVGFVTVRPPQTQTQEWSL